MSEIKIDIRQQVPLETQYKVKAQCCREWDLAAGFPPGRCGLCGTVPEVVPGSLYL